MYGALRIPDRANRFQLPLHAATVATVILLPVSFLFFKETCPNDFQNMVIRRSTAEVTKKWNSVGAYKIPPNQPATGTSNLRVHSSSLPPRTGLQTCPAFGGFGSHFRR